VLFKDYNQKYTAEELALLRGLVAAADYKHLPADTPSYERLARLYEGLERPAFEIGQAYLKASWQVEDQAERNRVLLEKSRKWFEKYLANAPNTDKSRLPAQFLRGELLRRVEKFQEAKEQFIRLGKSKEYESAPFPTMIAQEMALIDVKDHSPRQIKGDDGH